MRRMLRTHKIQLQPRPAQADWLRRQMAYEKWAYNRALANFKAGLDWGVWQSETDLRKSLRRQRPDWIVGLWMKGSDTGVKRLTRAIRAWRNKNQRNRFPRFKRAADSCMFWDAARYEGGRRVKMPILGSVRMREPIRFDGRLKTTQVKWDGRRWWLIAVVDTQAKPAERTSGYVVGVDVGIKTLAVTSDGREYANPMPLKNALGSLRRVSKAISRSINTHGRNRPSNRRRRLYMTLRRQHEHIADIRKDAQRQAASAIVKNADAVCVEDLNVTGMVKNHKLSRAISDSALGGLLSEIAWQCEKRGVNLIEAHRFYPSSKTCSACGAEKRKLMLSEREYVCGECGVVIDRDYNSALNLEKVALSALRGETVRPAFVGASLRSANSLMD